MITLKSVWTDPFSFSSNCKLISQQLVTLDIAQNRPILTYIQCDQNHSRIRNGGKFGCILDKKVTTTIVRRKNDVKATPKRRLCDAKTMLRRRCIFLREREKVCNSIRRFFLTEEICSEILPKIVYSHFHFYLLPKDFTGIGLQFYPKSKSLVICQCKQSYWIQTSHTEPSTIQKIYSVNFMLLYFFKHSDRSKSLSCQSELA